MRVSRQSQDWYTADNGNLLAKKECEYFGPRRTDGFVNAALNDRSGMDVHLIDGTYELFRYFFAVPSAKDRAGQEIGAVRGVLGSILSMIEGGATHLGVATDHVVESFRNDLYPGYKTSEGVAPELLSQFPILEEGLAAEYRWIQSTL